ncbi:hypothetical protein [Anaerotignum sp.]
MYNRRYDKVFLMLRQEVAGYAISKRPPWGSCVMELKNGKGRLHLTVQGLKPLGHGYTVYVMAGEESIFCGELHPDRREGRGELKWEFRPDAVGAGKKAEDFHTVLILAEDGTGGLSAPLTAYFGEKKNWKKDFKPMAPPLQPIEKETKPQEEEIIIQAAEAAVMTSPVPSVSEKWEEGAEQAKDSNAKVAEAQKNSFHGSFQGLLAKFRQELDNLEETGILTKQETENIRNLGASSAPQMPEQTEQTEEKSIEILAEEEKTEEKMPLPEPAAKKEPLFAKNRELEPFGDGELWKCLSLEELILLSQIPLKWQREFFFLLPYRRYHHLILQEKEEGIWLGLPGVYHAKDEADARSFGFGEFRRVEGEWGYWVAFLQREG